MLRTTCFEVSPWRMGFEATTRFPSAVLAPVLAKLLILFARLWARVDMMQRNLFYRLQYRTWISAPTTCQYKATDNKANRRKNTCERKIQVTRAALRVRLRQPFAP